MKGEEKIEEEEENKAVEGGTEARGGELRV